MRVRAPLTYRLDLLRLILAIALAVTYGLTFFECPFAFPYLLDLSSWL
jgi:hypothetical protein